jgi:RNA polymerase sigma factor (sigma-70 family)
VGHERAFEVLVHRYRRQLLRYCARMGLSEQLAEDVVQHSLLQAWVALGSGTAVREPRPWLYRIAHNTAVNAVRGAREEPLAPAAGGEGDGVAALLEQDPARGMTLRETLSDVAALPQMQREAIVLSAIDGRSHEEVARVLGVSDGAVRGLLYRARATLRAAAAALTPAPLLEWASGAITRAAPTAARLTELSAGASSGDAGAMLFKGVAVAATAALAAGAVLVPLRAHHSSTHRVAGVKDGTTPAPGSERHAAQLRAAAGQAPARSAAGAFAGAPGLRGAPAVGVSKRRRGSAVLAPGALTPSGSGRRLAVVRPQGPPAAVGPGGGAKVEAARAGAGAGAQAATPSESPPPAGGGSGVSEAPSPSPPPAGGAPAAHEEPSEQAEQEAEAARELKEREADKAREARESEEEAARERHEREEEAAREAREREAERAGK